MTTIYHDPGNTRQAETLFAWISIDKLGLEGIMAITDPDLGMLPLVTLSLETAMQFREAVEKACAATGKKVRLCAYKRENVLLELT